MADRLSLKVYYISALLLLSFSTSVNGAFSGKFKSKEREIPSTKQLEHITLEDIVHDRLAGEGFSGEWVHGSDHLIRVFKPHSVLNFNIKDGTEEIVLNMKEITDKLPPGSQISNLTFSNDNKFVLVGHGRSLRYRFSSIAKYDIYDVEKRKMVDKLVSPGYKDDVNHTQEALQLVQWSPTGNGIAFIYNYNIYYRLSASAGTPVRQLTFDGSEENAIYNGIADWVYEEDMFESPTAMWISRSGKHIAFLKFNDSNVMEIKWPVYKGVTEALYPEVMKIRYPKVGTPNPDVKLYVMSLTEGSADYESVSFPDIRQKDHHIIGRVAWVSDNQLLVAILNRLQTVCHWYFCHLPTTKCDNVHTYKVEHGWVDMYTPEVSKETDKFIFIRPQIQEQDEKSGMTVSYNHITMVRNDGSSVAVTKGRLSVDAIVGWDEGQHKIYFSGTFWNGTHADASESHIFSVSDTSNETMKCITCNLINSVGNKCRYNFAIFSANFSHFIHECIGPDVSETTTRNTEDGSPIQYPGPTFVNNSEVRKILQRKAVPIKKEYEIPVGPNGRFLAKARLFLPHDYDEKKKYPLLIHVYGAPGYQWVKQKYEWRWEAAFASDLGVIYGQIDGRGTGKQSIEHMFQVYRRLGTVEIEDQVTVTRWFIENLPFIDADKTAIWGHSYGGFVALRILESSDVFKCGIANAPITDWRYYDSIYTERYMGLPTETDNLKAYESSEVVAKHKIEKLRTKHLMLVHGNADENVHYQQSMVLMRALEQNDIFFHQLSYPDENHRIGETDTDILTHFIHSVRRFLFHECYHLPIPSEEKHVGVKTSGGGVVAAPMNILLYSVSLFVIFEYVRYFV